MALRREANNLVATYAALSGETTAQVLARFAGQGFGAFKPALAEVVVAAMIPVGDAMRRFLNDPAEIDRILAIGAERAITTAEPILAEVKRKVGFWRPPPSLAGGRGHIGLRRAGEREMIVVEDVAFGEGPRWRDGALYWSDMHGHAVKRLVDGEVQTVCEVPTRPSGLGWLPDGRMLVVSMSDRRVLRREADGALVVHADLCALAPRRCNDMTVDALGRAYVGNFGFELDSAEEPCATVLIRVDPGRLRPRGGRRPAVPQRHV